MFFHTPLSYGVLVHLWASNFSAFLDNVPEDTFLLLVVLRFEALSVVVSFRGPFILVWRDNFVRCFPGKKRL